MSHHDTLAAHGVQSGDILDLLVVQVGGKPVIYVYPPSGSTLDVRLDLSLVPQWEFSAIYPVVPAKTEPEGGQSISWSVKALPDGSLREVQTGLDVSYLYWEAEYVLFSWFVQMVV